MGGPPKQTIPLSVLARNQTKDSWTWNLAVSRSGKGTRMRVGWKRSWEAVDDGDPGEAVGVGQQRGEQQSWRGTTDRGSQHRTPEQRGEAAWDRVQRQWVKMSLHSSSLVEFSLVTHASVSPYMLSGMHMHVVLHNSFCSLLTPSFVHVCSFVLLFSPFPRSYSCVGKEMCVTPLNHLLITGRRKKWHG